MLVLYYRDRRRLDTALLKTKEAESKYELHGSLVYCDNKQWLIDETGLSTARPKWHFDGPGL